MKYLFTLLVLIPITYRAQEEVKSESITFSIVSNSYNQEQSFLTASHYKRQKSKESPILIVLDADQLFDLTSSISRYYVNLEKISPLTVVGFSHTNRYAELTGKDAEITKAIINEELIPYLREDLHLSGRISILGHSFSADFILNHLNDMPDIYSTAVISGISKKTTLEEIANPNGYFYSADNDFSHRVDYFDTLKSSIKKEATQFKKFEDKDHLSIVIPAIEDFILHQYSKFISLTDEEKASLADSKQQLAELKKIKHSKDTAFGINYHPNLEDIVWLMEVINEEELEQSLSWLLTLNLVPIEKTVVHKLLGEFYEKNEKYKLAYQNFKNSCESLPDWVTNTDDFCKDMKRIGEMDGVQK